MRKIIQIAECVAPAQEGVHGTVFSTTALCDDGTAWRRYSEGSGWVQIPPIPQDEGPEKLPDDLPLCNCFELNKNPSSITQRCKVCAHDADSFANIMESEDVKGICERCGANNQEQQFYNDYLCFDCKVTLDRR